MNPPTDETRCSWIGARALSSVFAAGLAHADRADLEDLMMALRVLSPDAAVADLCEARLLMRSNRWLDALRMLAQVDGNGAHEGGASKVNVLRAWCLLQLREPRWRSCIDAALGSADAGAVAAATALLVSTGMTVER